MGRGLRIASMLVLVLGGCSSLEGLTSPSDAGSGGDAGSDTTATQNDGGQDADGCSASIADDAKNCGACGHDCRGGKCTDGTCEPRTLARVADSPYGMTIDEATIYWAGSSSSSIWACDKTGCDTGPRKVTTATGTTYFVSSDATNVYFNSNSGDAMYRCPKTGCATPAVLTSIDAPTLNVVDGGYVWWSDNNGGVRKVAIDATMETAMTVASSLNDPTGLALDASYVYVAVRGAGQLVRVARTGVSFEVLDANLSSPAAVAVDASGVYVGTSDGKIRRWANGMMTTFATGAGPVGYAIVLTTDDVFWTVMSDAGAVMTAPKATGLARVLAANQAKPAALVVDDAAVYWTNSGDGTVKMLAR